MKVRFLGTGTSTGIPEMTCQCRVCRSEDPRDKRLRSSALIETGGVRILIDCGPDFREQMISSMKREFFDSLDGVLLTHEHYDHMGGLDDLRSFGRNGAVSLYAEQEVAEAIRERLPYAFRNHHPYPGVPNLCLKEISLQPFQIKQVSIQPIRLMHGQLPILGYRIGNLAYLTDLKTIPEEEYKKLEGLDVLIMNALRPEEHFAHQSINEALAQVERIKPRRTYLIHMSHSFGEHAEMEHRLPENVFIAYDNLTVSV